jgi:Protein of unknown function (DUF2778)
MFRFNQSTGKVTHDGGPFGWAYSGHGAGVNNPELQYEPEIGPIPVGSYTIGAPFTHPHAGPVCMRLTPNPGTDDKGRAGFMWHGDNAANNRTASEGCIISPHTDRLAVAALVSYGDNQLEVVSQ